MGRGERGGAKTRAQGFPPPPPLRTAARPRAHTVGNDGPAAPGQHAVHDVHHLGKGVRLGGRLAEDGIKEEGGGGGSRQAGPTRPALGKADGGPLGGGGAPGAGLGRVQGAQAGDDADVGGGRGGGHGGAGRGEGRGGERGGEERRGGGVGKIAAMNGATKNDPLGPPPLPLFSLSAPPP